MNPIDPLESNAPWQLKWKRPRLSKSSASVPVAAATSEDVVEQQQNDSPRLDGMVSIECKSARLTYTEMCSILDHINNNNKNATTKKRGSSVGDVGYGNNLDNKDEETMKWEDLESSSDEEAGLSMGRGEKYQKHMAHDKEEQYLLNITTLASPTSVKLLKTLQDYNLSTTYGSGWNGGGSINESLAADSIHLEVVKDSCKMKDYHSESKNNFDDSLPTPMNNENRNQDNDKANVIMSKLLRWPSSALIDTEANISNSIEEGLFHTWQSIRKLLRIKQQSSSSSPENNNNVQEIDHQEIRKLEWRAKLLRERIGLTSFALCRQSIHNNTATATATAEQQQQQRNDEKVLDVDDMYEILNRMSFGTSLKSNTYPVPVANHHDIHGMDAGGIDNHHQENENDDELLPQRPQSELLLSCLTNDGKVHLFSALDLLLDTTNENTTINNNGNNVNTKGDIENEMEFNNFETLLFGNELQRKLKESVLPLSQPRASVDLSIISDFFTENDNDLVKIKELDLIQEVEEEDDEGDEEKSNDNDNSMSKEKEDEETKDSDPIITNKTQTLNDEHAGTNSTNYEDYGISPLIDFSFLDSNIEPSTLHYKTIRNVPVTCISAFDYVVIGGKGLRKYKKRKQPSSTEVKNTNMNVSSHTSEDMKREESYEQGGFVSFISLKYLSEARTVFLPFAPRVLSPVRWNNMQLVIVIGDKADQCIAIRTDASSNVLFDPNFTNENEIFQSSNNDSHREQCLVKKFSLIEISFPDQMSCINKTNKTVYPLSVTSVTADPPCIILSQSSNSNITLTLHRMTELVCNESQSQESRTGNYRGTKTTIVCCNEDRHKVKIPNPSRVKGARKSVRIKDNNEWCVSGKGWSLLGVDVKGNINLFFIIWEGAKENAYYLNVLSGRFDNFCQYSNILPVTYANRNQVNQQNNNTSLNLSSSSSIMFFKGEESGSDAIIVNVIKEIRKQSGLIDPSAMSNILLRRCPSWTELDDSIDTVDDQIAVTTIRYSGKNHFLTLRKNVAANTETCFQEILMWLCQEKDFYTAASVALNLLDDVETFWDLTGYEHNCSQDLLDGIIPVQSISQSNRNEDNASNQRIYAAFTSLADMTIACLVKGGSNMSHALDGFLGRNEYYDASKACLVLGASTALAVSKVSQLNQMDNLAPFSFDPLMSETHALWPIQCLLRVAVTRNCMSTALLLLNATIPNEMRNIAGYGVTNSIVLCKSIISMILASSPVSASILLNLVHGRRDTYWTSISIDTRFELSLLQIRGKFPLFHETEVRQWALGLLHRATGLIETFNTETDAPIIWLQKLCLACLCNAECDFSLLELNSSVEEKKDWTEEDLFLELENEEIFTSTFITSAQSSIDFDLLIPSLLLLQKKKLNWNDDAMVSTQSILNIVCCMAGKPTLDEFIFVFDSASVMKQCALMGNIGAAANLIGGNDGIVLRCANIITFGDANRIQEAEEFLLGKKDDVDFGENLSDDYNKSTTDEFILTEGHREILWCLDKYVLSAKRYGEFFSSSNRGSIDPTFAARICLRSWLSLCRSRKTFPASGKWLENWLTATLQKDGKLLARAAITRCLLWTEIKFNDKDTKKIVLGESLGLSNQFLVMMSKDSSGGIINLV